MATSVVTEDNHIDRDITIGNSRQRAQDAR